MEGSRGGSVIGHTRSGKPIYHAGHSHYSSGSKHKFKGWSHEDHEDASTAHHKNYERAKNAMSQVAKKHEMETGNPVSDSKPAHEVMSGARLVEYRKHQDAARNSFHAKTVHAEATHKKSQGDSQMDLLKSLEQMADVAMTLLSPEEQCLLPVRTDILGLGGDGDVTTPRPGLPNQLGAGGTDTGDFVPYRVDILAPSVYTPNEQISMAKSVQQNVPVPAQIHELQRCGLALVGPRKIGLSKSRLSILEFADALGTTENTVRALAKRCGDVDHFVAMIRERLPDIQRAHGLTDGDAQALYAVTMRTLKSLNPLEWCQWMSKSFANQAVSDTALADAIRQNGLMDRNNLAPGGFVVHDERSDLESATPISAPLSRPARF
jgi:hypothetical protein